MLLRKDAAMRKCSIVSAACLLFVAMAAFMAGLAVETTLTREDRAIATLLRANAEFQRLPVNRKEGHSVMNRCDNKDELLRFVPSIKNIKGIDLARGPD